MIKLYDLDDYSLSLGIRSLSSLTYDANQLENRLLDGSFHVQTIGEAAQYFEFEILANQNQVDKINLAHSISENLKLIIDSEEYTGIISSPKWNRITKRYKNESYRYFVSLIRFDVIEEGTV